MLEPASEKGSRRSSHSSTRSESDFSVWSDTGDLAEQIAEEDPLQIRLRNSLDRELLGRKGRRKHNHRVHYPPDLETEGSALVKEKIRVPNPPPRRISRLERILAITMSPGNRQNAQMHGLVGKPLL